MIHVNTWHGGEIIAAYITDGEVPSGTIAGRQGNAVLILDGDKEVVVSSPRIEGDVVAFLGAEDAPEVDLAKYF